MKQFRKAYVAAAVGLVGAIGAACADGSLTSGEVVIAVGVGLTAGAATYGIKNG